MMDSLILMAVSLVVSMSPLSAGHQQNPDLSVLMTKMELAADYAADSRATHNAARATAVSTTGIELNSAFDRLEHLADLSVGKKYQLSILVRNDGSKTVRTVTLEYPLGYSRGRTQPERLSFRFSHNIKPGETRTILHSFISSKHVVLRSGEQAVIERIVYIDGSVWRRN
jgi:hypothetical protein